MGTLDITPSIRRVTYQTKDKEMSYYVGLYMKNSRRTITEIYFDRQLFDESSLLVYHIWVLEDGQTEKKIWKTLILSSTAEIEYESNE